MRLDGRGQPSVVELQSPGQVGAGAAVGVVPLGGQGGQLPDGVDVAGPAGPQLVAAIMLTQHRISPPPQLGQPRLIGVAVQADPVWGGGSAGVGGVERGDELPDWRRPQYGQLLARPDCPAWARTFIEQASGTLSCPEAFDSFGGWGGELLQARDGRFVLIDWPGLGAAPRGSRAALSLEILLRFGAADPAPLVERFLAGWVPAGLDRSRLEDLRLRWAHAILWWAGLDLSLGADPDVDLTGVYAAAWHSLANDDPVSWLSQVAAAAAP